MAEIPPIPAALWNAISHRVLDVGEGRLPFSQRDRIVKQTVAHIDELVARAERERGSRSQD